MTESFGSAVEGLVALLEKLKLLSEIPDLDDLLEDDDGNPPPLISPSKEAELSWPTTTHRPELAPAWPPFSGHRVPLGGDRR